MDRTAATAKDFLGGGPRGCFEESLLAEDLCVLGLPGRVRGWSFFGGEVEEEGGDASGLLALSKRKERVLGGSGSVRGERRPFPSERVGGEQYECSARSE